MPIYNWKICEKSSKSTLHVIMFPIMMQAAENPTETDKTHKEDLLAPESLKNGFQDSPKVSIRIWFLFYKHFTKEYVQKARRSMKRCSALLAISEMSIKTKVKY